MLKERVAEIVRENIEFARTGTIRQAKEIGRVPIEHYFAADRWQRECDQIFKRLPLVLATTSELRQPGDYKALTVMDKPILVCRTAGGAIKAFENSCAHRGAQVVAAGRGNAKRLQDFIVNILR